MHFVCRTCLQTGTNFRNLFNNFENDKALSEMLMECVIIKLEDGDGLPCHICDDCKDKLNSAWNFRSLALKSDSILRNCDIVTVLAEGGSIEKEHCDLKIENIVVPNSVHQNVYNNSNVNVKEQAQNPHSLVVFVPRSVNNVLEDVSKLKDTLLKSAQQNNENEYLEKFVCKNTSVPVKDVKECSQKSVSDCCENSDGVNDINLSQMKTNQKENEAEDLSSHIYRNKCTREEKEADQFPKDTAKIPNDLDCVEDQLLKTKSFITENQGILQDVSNVDNNMSVQCQNLNNSTVISNDFSIGNDSTFSSDSDKTNSEVPLELTKNKGKRNRILIKDNIFVTKFDKRGRPVGIPAPKIHCKVCNKLVSLSYYHNEHIHKHTDGFLCKICNKTFHSEYLLKTHQAVHQNQKHICDICQEGFPTYYKLLRHRLSHKGQIHMCTICKKTFTWKKVLERHVQRHKNQKQTMFICELCGKAFPALVNLKIHYESHNTEKTVPCPKCGKLFANHRKVTAHLIWHNTDHSHVCEYCNKGFKTLMSKKRHVLIHTGEKRHVCKVCEKRFTDGGTLSRHMLTHTKETPYSCEKCPYKCTYKQQLDRHLKKHK